MKNKKIIYLPVFAGFYNTIHEFDNEYVISDFIEEIESYTNVSNIDKETVKKGNYCDSSDIFDKYYGIDYKEYMLDYSKEYVDNFNELLKEPLEKIGISNIEFKSIFSPTYYNYWNDEINININYDFDMIKNYLENNAVNFSNYIKDKNASYDGFIAFGDTDYNEYIKGNTFEAFELTQIIEFYLVNEKVEINNLDFIENIYLTNYIIDAK